MNNNTDKDDSFIVYIDNIDEDYEGSDIVSDTSSLSNSDTHIVYSSNKDKECYTDEPIYNYYKDKPQLSAPWYTSSICLFFVLMCTCIKPLL